MRTFFNGFAAVLVGLAIILQLQMISSAQGDPDRLTPASNFYHADRLVIAFIGITIILLALSRGWVGLGAISIAVLFTHFAPYATTQGQANTYVWLLGTITAGCLAIIVPSCRWSWLAPRRSRQKKPKLARAA